MNYKEQLEGFPQEVVEAMLDEQVKQGNKRDVTVFEKDKTQSQVFRGFDWHATKEGKDFWDTVIMHANFDVFFTKYPKKSVYPKVMLVRDRLDQEWQQKTVLLYLGDNFYEPFCTDDGFEDGKVACLFYRFGKNIEEGIKEVTLQEVAKAFNVDVKKLRIKD